MVAVGQHDVQLAPVHGGPGMRRLGLWGSVQALREEEAGDF